MKVDENLAVDILEDSRQTIREIRAEWDTTTDGQRELCLKLEAILGKQDGADRTLDEMFRDLYQEVYDTCKADPAFESLKCPNCEIPVRQFDYTYSKRLLTGHHRCTSGLIISVKMKRLGKGSGR